MLKKIFFTFSLGFSISYSAWSQPSADNISGELAEIVTNTASNLNNETINKYNKDIKPLIEKIQILTEKKKKLLTEIQALEKEKAVYESQAVFFLYQEKNLLGNYGSIISVDKKETENE